MSDILCITGWFDTYKDGIKTGKKEFLVSHGVDMETGKVVILPNEHPSVLGAFKHQESGEWIIKGQ
jgi:hypothetical protein